MTVDAAATELRHRFDLDRRLEPFEHLRYRLADAGTPALHLDDFAAIPFLGGVSGVEHYQHRARLRARGGDVYAATTSGSAGYERYCREILGLGAVEELIVHPGGDPLALARACMADRGFLERLGALARRGGLVVEPFLGSEAIWNLAAELAGGSGARLRVLASPPPVTWIANDKANFEDLVTAVLGPGFLPESRRAASPRELARALLELAETGPSVALKRLRCASAMGNEVFESAALRRWGFPAVLEIVRGFLERTGWEGDEDVLAVRWEQAVSSPSTQWWLPPPGGGEPVLGGVYEQILAGEEGVFVGSRPSGLAAEVEERIVSQSGQVAAALQRLGYVGRCSFDHLVLPDGRTVFTECNGRWGGTSTPMNLVDRLYPGGRPPYQAQAFTHPELVGITFRQLLARLGDAVHERGAGAGRFLLYNVGPLRQFGKFDVVALGSSRSHVEDLIAVELPRRLSVT